MSDLVGNPEDRFSHKEAHLGFDFTKDLDQPGHLPILIRVFTVNMKVVKALDYSLSTQL